MDVLLEKAFEIIISTSWFSALPKGSIFLVEEEPDVLVLKAKLVDSALVFEMQLKMAVLPTFVIPIIPHFNAIVFIFVCKDT